MAPEIETTQDSILEGPPLVVESGTTDGATAAPADTVQDPAKPTAELDELRARAENAEHKRDEAVRQTIRLVQALEEEARTEIPTTDGTETSFKERFEQDPEKALEEHFAKRMQPLVRRQTATQAGIIRDMERGKLKSDPVLSRVLEKHEGDVDQFLGGMGEDVQASPGAYTNALAFTLAGKMLNSDGRKEIWGWLKDEFGTGNPNDPPLVEAGSAPGPRPSERPTMSALEKTIASEMGVADKDWLEMKDEHARLGKW